MRNISVGFVLTMTALGWLNSAQASFPKSCPTVERITSVFTARPGDIKCYAGDACVYSVKTPIMEGSQSNWSWFHHSWHFYLVIPAKSVDDAQNKVDKALQTLTLKTTMPVLKLQLPNVWQCSYGTSSDAFGTTIW
jgi:hypothetical protein